MNRLRFALSACASAFVALLLTSCASTQDGPRSSDTPIYTKGLPNLDPAVCRSNSASGPGNLCSTGVPFEVVVSPLMHGGKTIGCAAFFLYRDLTIVTPKGGEATTVNWTITDVGTVLGAAAKFVAPGIQLSEKPGQGNPSPGDLFDTPTYLGLNASVKVKKQGAKKSFDHLPVVSYMDKNLAWTPCGGVDPTISNNPS